MHLEYNGSYDSTSKEIECNTGKIFNAFFYITSYIFLMIYTKLSRVINDHFYCAAATVMVLILVKITIP